jgi:hypothetical protein
MARINRIIALPLLTAGILGGAIGLAGTASAGVTVDDRGGMVASPDTYAAPATEYVPWGAWIQSGNVVIPQVDTTVVQSR